MTKAELTRIIATHHDVDPATALKLINSFLRLIVSTTAAGVPVQLHGFGTFTLATTARPVRGHLHGRVPDFRPSKAYRQRVR